MALADFNRDGRLDLALSNFSQTSRGTVSILVNATRPGAPTPRFAVESDLSIGGSPWVIEAADINGDGLPDLAVTEYYQGGIAPIMNTTAVSGALPRFGAPASFAAGADARAAALVDLNGDGKPDFVAASGGVGGVSVRIARTAPGADIPDLATQMSFPTDLNGDGLLDLATSGASSGSVIVLMQRSQ